MHVGRKRARILKAALARGINLRSLDDGALGISLDETTTVDDLRDLCAVFSAKGGPPVEIERMAETARPSFGANLARQSSFLTHPVFSRYHSEIFAIALSSFI